MTAKSTTPAALTWSGVTARRMARHSLTEPAADLGPADIAGALCGAHAQVLSAAELSIGRRIAGATSACVRRALWQERTLVKTNSWAQSWRRRRRCRWAPLRSARTREWRCDPARLRLIC
jgi:hypothetical protein